MRNPPGLVVRTPQEEYADLIVGTSDLIGLKSLAMAEISAENLESRLAQFLSLKERISNNPILDKYAAIYDPKITEAPTVAPISYLTTGTAILTAAVAIIATASAGNNYSEEDNSRNSALLAGAAIGTISYIANIFSARNDHFKNSAGIELERGKIAEALKELVNNFDKKVTRSELDNLLNSTDSENNEKNLIREKYWRDFFEEGKNKLLNNSAVMTKDEAMELFYCGAALASFYSADTPRQDLSAARAISELNLAQIKAYCGINESYTPSIPDLANSLERHDVRLPTLYARVAYQLGRGATKRLDNSMPESERKYLANHLDEASAIRNLIDKSKKTPTNPSGRYDDQYNNRQDNNGIDDTLLFNRSGLWESQLFTIEIEIDEASKARQPLTSDINERLQRLYTNFESAREEGPAKGGDRIHDYICDEKMINVLSQQVKISDNLEEMRKNTGKARIILFYNNDINQNSFETNLNNPDKRRLVMRSTAKLAGMYARCLDDVTATQLNNFLTQTPNLNLPREVRNECADNETLIQDAVAKNAAPPSSLMRRSASFNSI